MATKTSNNIVSLQVSSYNCRGIKSSTLDVQSLCEQSHIVLLQETWLAKQSQDYLFNINNDLHAGGISPMDLSNRILVGRPYGGTAILWNKNLNAKVVYNYDQSIIGITVELESTSLTIINVYLPSCSSDNEDIFREELSKVKSFYDSIGTPNVCLIGDFNASDSNRNGQILRDFC